MDCRIIDNKVIIRDGCAVSVPPNHFDDTDQTERYYGIVLKLIQNDKQARVQWMDDKSKSIENMENVQLETEIPQKPKKFVLRIKPKNQSDDAQFEADLTPKDSSNPGKCFCYFVSSLVAFGCKLLFFKI